MNLIAWIGLLSLSVSMPGAVGVLMAQNRPAAQDTSIWMNGFVADGKLDEWTEPLLALDQNNAIEYSLANDDLYLYLVVRSNHTAKVLMGGVSLIVERPEKADAMVLFPYNPAHDMSGDILAAMMDPRRPRSIREAELIETSGITGDQDSIIYIANEYGIQAAGGEMKVNTEMYPEGESHYIVEMAIPLQYLDLSPEADLQELNYRIRLRGLTVKGGMGYGMGGHAVMAVGGFGSGGTGGRRQRQYEQIKSRDQTVPTELKGVYRLASPD